jgi:hypothetical protein
VKSVYHPVLSFGSSFIHQRGETQPLRGYLLGTNIYLGGSEIIHLEIIDEEHVTYLSWLDDAGREYRVALAPTPQSGCQRLLFRINRSKKDEHEEKSHSLPDISRRVY